MKKIVAFIILFSLLFSNSLTAFAQNEEYDWVSNVTRAAVKEWSDQLFTDYLNNNGYVGGIISVVKDGEIIYEEGYGYSNYFEGIKADPITTPFRSGSTSKVFTAIAIMQQVEEGVIDLDKSANDYLTRFKMDETYDKVTVRDLLTHTAAYEERFRNTLFVDVDEELASSEYLEKFKHHQIDLSGERIQYSNYGLGMLGIILEDVTGKTYREYLTENIFTPLAMNYTFVETPNHLPLSKIAVEHVLTSDGVISQQDFYYKAPAFLGSGGLFYTSHDMGLFMNSILNQSTDILKKDTWEQMLTVQEFANPFSGVGYGFWIYEREENEQENYWDGETIVGHSGGTETFKSKMILFPKDDIGIFVGVVGSASRTYLEQASFNPHLPIDSFIKTFRGEKTFATAPAQPDFLKQFAGIYQSTRRAWAGSEAYRDQLIYENLNVFMGGDQLYINGFGELNFGGGNSYELKHIQNRTFFIEEKAAIISFSQNGKYLTKDVYNNYDKINWYQTSKVFLILVLASILFLLTSIILYAINKRKGCINFEKTAILSSGVAIATALFPFIVFGILGIHFRLENRVFLYNNILGWLTLILTLILSFYYVIDLKNKKEQLTKARIIHRGIILISHWLLNYLFVIYDVIRIFES